MLRAFVSVWIFAVLLSSASAGPPRLWVIDSAHRPLDKTAQAAYRQSQHPDSRVAFEWIRIGGSQAGSSAKDESEEELLEVLRGLAGGSQKKAPKLRPTPDPDGSRTTPLKLLGLPRVVLLSGDGTVLWQEVDLTEAELRRVCRSGGKPLPLPAPKAKIQVNSSLPPPGPPPAPKDPRIPEP